MSDSKPAEVLDYLREQFARVHVKLDRLIGDIDNPKVRMSAAEAEAGHVRIGLAEVNSRLDKMDKRLDRIERRLDLIEAEA
jgi:tetrahydromethanopterin S-methyltransferase subunit G